MNVQVSLEDFDKIYDETYNKILKFVICKCPNMDDVNDIIQDSYCELYHILNKKKILYIENITSYLIGIAKNRLKKYYGMFYRLQTVPLFNETKELQLIDTIPNDINIDAFVINKECIDDIWSFLKNKKPIIMKIFCLYYKFDMKIIDIAKELNISESTVKNNIYRTLKELSLLFKED